MPSRLAFSFAALAALSLGGCSSFNDPGTDSMTVKTQFGLPALRAAEVGIFGVAINIDSNGCTTKKTIEAEVDQDGENEYEIAFDLRKEDTCEAYMPDGVQLRWSREELDIPEDAKIRVLNRITDR